MPDPIAAALLAAVATAVGFFIGAVGVGGVLLIPFLVLLGGLDIHSAAATALFTFLFTGLLGTWLFQRRGSIQWRLAVPVCAGATIAGYLGAAAASRIDPRPLTLLIALIIMVAGLWVLRPAPERERARGGGSRGDTVTLLGVGAASGFGSGLSGAGGPLFSVPIMVLLGFSPLAAIGVSQVIQIFAAVSGSLSSVQDGRIHFGIAAWVTAFELAGVVAGTWLAHSVSGVALRRIAACLCIAVAVLMAVRAW
ncbi:MAG: sulfite exporter TauE/SafE family protein [Pseudomonadota bacterium]|nr:sulfite exporter TauE/SafE family protein [Pseudomonadota bacterium]